MIKPLVGPQALSHSAAVATLMQQAFPIEYGEAWTESQLRGALLLTGTHLYLAESDKNLHGFALTRTVIDECELLLIAVKPSKRGQSIGSHLMAAIEGHCRGHRVTRIFLEMRENNGAWRLYDRFGFTKIGQRAGYYRGQDGRKYDALTFAKQIV